MNVSTQQWRQIPNLFLVIRESMGQTLYKLSSMKFKDPNKESEEKILADFADLHEEMVTGFKNLEEF